MPLHFDRAQFWGRVKKLYASWRTNGALWKNVDAIAVVNGKQMEQVLYRRTLSLQLWLTGFELFDTVFVFAANTVYVIASSKKIKLFEELGESDEDAGVSLTLLTKKSDNEENFAAVTDGIKKSHSGKRIGMVVKDTAEGEFGKAFVSAISSFDVEDIASGVADVLAVKDTQEMSDSRIAGQIASEVMSKVFWPSIESAIVDEKTVSHKKLSEECDDLIANPEALAKVLPNDLDYKPDEVDSSFVPVVMSGGKYELKSNAASNKDNLQADTIITVLGTRYHSYCTNLARTYFIDANAEQQRNYRVLTKVYEACLGALQAGGKLSDVYKAAIRVIRARAPQLESNFTKNCGYGTGIGFRESSFVLSAGNGKAIRSGMVFVLSVGFEGLVKRTRKGEETYAMMLADTVLVTPREPEVLTPGSFSFSDVSFQMDGDDEEEEGEGALPLSFAEDGGPRTRGARKQNVQVDKEEEEKRREEQKALAMRKHQEAMQRFAVNRMDTQFNEARERPAIMNAYASPSAYPSEARPNQLFVDVSNETLLAPINGQLVPFHIDTIKSISKGEVGDSTSLRINFVTPDNKDQIPPYANKAALFVKELTYKSRDPRNLNRVLRLVKELKKRIKQREKTIAEEATIVEQEDLRLIKDKAKVPRLRDLQVRPKLGPGKKQMGTLEAHLNGFRFYSNKGERIDFTYSSIKNAFFQPCENSVSVILHFYLKNPMRIGTGKSKKKTTYVQVYADVIEASQDLNVRRKTYDRDGLQEEQEERMRRKKFNERFRAFVRSVEDMVAKTDPNNHFEFDIPYRDLMFRGVPDKSAVPILPTLNCLIALEDNPPFVLALDEIEIAYFERVQLSLKNFDLVFIFKDFSRPVAKIRSIPMTSVNMIQSYLNESEIVYFQGPMNLQWPRILKEVSADPKGFYEMGGWESILGEDEEAEDEEDAMSEFEMEESEEDPTDSEEFVSDDDAFEEDDDSFVSDEDEEAPTWEELEKEAIDEDRKHVVEQEDPQKRKKQRRH